MRPRELSECLSKDRIQESFFTEFQECDLGNSANASLRIGIQESVY
ncbi:hypothetical protein LEP1GSC170_2003 [Leptospira interrogans serovar Bataviae str. HAI135]|nr:hypothetical protein LEP1GSC170_2003 [Leptospira interrogans serovar Bataviae str. HAI135]